MKHLYKSRKNKMLAGVCGGIAEYFEVDPVLVRVIFILLTIFGGSGILAYIIGIIIIPQAPLGPLEAGQTPGTSSTGQDTQGYQSPNPSQSYPQQQDPPVTEKNSGALIVGIVLTILGFYFLLRNIPLFHDFYWWLHWHVHDYIVPAILVLIGVALIMKSRKS